MAVEAIKAIGQKFVSKINSKSAEKAATVAVKDGEKALATAQEAAAVQGKAMVKPYIKPQTTDIKVKQTNLMAASGNTNPVVSSSPDMPGAGAREYHNYSIWDNEW